jgi:hypothetical protein
MQLSPKDLERIDKMKSAHKRLAEQENVVSALQQKVERLGAEMRSLNERKETIIRNHEVDRERRQPELTDINSGLELVLGGQGGRGIQAGFGFE